MLNEASDVLKEEIRKIENKDEVIYQLAKYTEEIEEYCPCDVPSQECFLFRKLSENDGCILCHILFAQRRASNGRKATDKI